MTTGKKKKRKDLKFLFSFGLLVNENMRVEFGFVAWEAEIRAEYIAYDD